MSVFPLDRGFLDLLKGKVVIVTGNAPGASSGIGLATSREFASRGALVIAADLNPLPEGIPGVTFQKTDLGIWKEQMALFDLALKKHGRIDVAFLNAGVYELEDIFVDGFDNQGLLLEPKYTVLNINLKAQVAGTKLAIHHMRKQATGGSIVVTGSGKCFFGVGGTPMYSAAKHGLLGMVRTLAPDLGTLNVRINLMCPFWTDTGIFPKEQLVKNASAQKSMQPPIACSYAVAHLALDETCQGRVVYVAAGTYTDVDQGLMDTRPLWLGKDNHLDRLVWEEDPTNAEYRTPL